MQFLHGVEEGLFVRVADHRAHAGAGDLRGSSDVRDELTVRGVIDNLTNIDPPIVAARPARGQSASYFTAFRGTIHHTIGRSYRIGARVKH